MHLPVVEDQRDPILVDIGGGEVLSGQTLDLVEDVPGRPLLDGLPVGGGPIVLNPIDFEEVELDVSEIRLVVTRQFLFLIFE